MSRTRDVIIVCRVATITYQNVDVRPKAKEKALNLGEKNLGEEARGKPGIAGGHVEGSVSRNSKVCNSLQIAI